MSALLAKSRALGLDCIRLEKEIPLCELEKKTSIHLPNCADSVHLSGGAAF